MEVDNEFIPNFKKFEICPNREFEPSTPRELFLSDMYDELIDFVEGMPWRRASVFLLYFGIGVERMTLSQMAKSLERSPPRVREIKEKAVQGVRFMLQRRFKFYLPYGKARRLRLLNNKRDFCLNFKG